jgi:hypothetical protein
VGVQSRQVANSSSFLIFSLSLSPFRFSFFTSYTLFPLFPSVLSFFPRRRPIQSVDGYYLSVFGYYRVSLERRCMGAKDLIKFLAELFDLTETLPSIPSLQPDSICGINHSRFFFLHLHRSQYTSGLLQSRKQ